MNEKSVQMGVMVKTLLNRVVEVVVAIYIFTDKIIEKGVLSVIGEKVGDKGKARF